MTNAELENLTEIPALITLAAISWATLALVTWRHKKPNYKRNKNSKGNQ